MTRATGSSAALPSPCHGTNMPKQDVVIGILTYFPDSRPIQLVVGQRGLVGNTRYLVLSSPMGWCLTDRPLPLVRNGSQNTPMGCDIGRRHSSKTLVGLASLAESLKPSRRDEIFPQDPAAIGHTPASSLQRWINMLCSCLGFVHRSEVSSKCFVQDGFLE